MLPHRCIHCGYDMTGTIAARPSSMNPGLDVMPCPECGKAWSREIEAKAPRWRGWPHFVWTSNGLQAIGWVVLIALLVASKQSLFLESFVPAIAYPLLTLVFAGGWIIALIVALQARVVARHARPATWMLLLVACMTHLTLITLGITSLQFLAW
jgi:hypothetical protein